MRNLNRFRIVTSALLLIGLLDGCAAERKCGFDSCTDDQKITAAVRTIFDQHPDLGPPAAIQVQTQNHIVYLNGLVGEGLERDAAASLARQVPGVARVENNIGVSH
jgi:osmotically-inducible protein OsmY